MDSDTHSTRLALILAVASTTLTLVGIAATIATPGTLSDVDGSGWNLISFAFPIAAFSIVGGVISLRRPDNVIGRLLGVIGLLFAVFVACSAVSTWAVLTGSLPRDVGEWIGLGADAGVPALGLIGTQLVLRLPDGALPSPRWRWFSHVSLAAIAVSLAATLVQPGPVEELPGTANPLGVESLKGADAIFLVVLACFVVALAALVGRYRRADAHGRIQLRWIAFGGALFVAVYVVLLALVITLEEDTGGAVGSVVGYLFAPAFALLPIAVGYAVLRHRLYDIDAVTSRALVYGALTATLAGAYLTLVLVLQFVLRPLTEQSDLAVAGSTLAVAALFRPARARFQAIVDRRFFRRRYDAQRALASFSSRLRDDVALDAISAELRRVVAETVQPAHASLWLRDRGQAAPRSLLRSPQR